MGQKLILSLEMLQTSDRSTARLWRAFKDGNCNTCPDAANSAGMKRSRARHHLVRLIDQGWLVRTGRVGKQLQYAATEESRIELPGPVKIGSTDAGRRIRQIKYRLTKMRAKVASARTSALPLEMGRALKDVEKECQILKDLMPSSR